MLGLERPPRWAMAAIAGLVVVDGLLIVQLGFAADTPNGSSQSASETTTRAGVSESRITTPAVSTAPAPPVAPTPPVIAVYGDGYTLGSSLGGLGAAGWPSRVAEQLNGEVRIHAVSGAGYAATGVSGEDFDDLASANPAPDADVTIVFGSRNDVGSAPAAAEAGAAETYRIILETAPETKLVVVGPAWSDARVPAELFEHRDAVERAARAVGATFVDPLVDEWFSDPTDLIAADDISPTDMGHAYLASLIGPAVQPLVTQD